VAAVVREYVNNESGIAELEATPDGYSPTVFFHACAAFKPNPEGNPYGMPTAFTTRDGPLSALFPVGCGVKARVALLQNQLVDHVAVALWPTTTEAPPKAPPPQPLAPVVQQFLSRARLEDLTVADVVDPVASRDLEPAQAKVLEVVDDNYGVIRLDSRRSRLHALFHREDVYLRDGKRAVDHEFFADKPLASMVRNEGTTMTGLFHVD